jgi:hypothetical protein
VFGSVATEEVERFCAWSINVSSCAKRERERERGVVKGREALRVQHKKVQTKLNYRQPTPIAVIVTAMHSIRERKYYVLNAIRSSASTSRSCARVTPPSKNDWLPWRVLISTRGY